MTSAERPIRVLVADDHAAVRSGVSRLLAAQPDMAIVAEAGSALEAIHSAGARPDVAVLDYHLGDRSGLWVARRLARSQPRPRVLLYSAFSDAALAVATIVAGADGLLGKSGAGEELCLAVRRLAAGQTYLPTVSSAVVDAMDARLPERRRAVFGMLVAGIAPELVRAQLALGERQLDNERTAILAILAPAASRVRPGAAAPPLRYEADRPRRAALT